MRTKAVALSAETHWVITESAEVIAIVDAERLTQAILQLCANAMTHGGGGDVIEIGSAVRGSRLVLWVRDHGEGIAPELQGAIFERFRRGASGRGTSGSGLGLAIVAAIAQSHGGSVGVESTPGSGARFTIDLPLHETLPPPERETP